MSAAAQNWLRKQHVEDQTLLAVLTVLASAADRAGVCRLTQAEIGRRAKLKARAVRNSIGLIEQIGAIHRARASTHSGREPDRITLALKMAFDITRGEIRGFRRVGATGTKTWVQEAFGAGAPTELSVRAHNARVRVIRSSPDSVSHLPLRCSGRAWWDAQRGQWRSRIRAGGEDLDLGRFANKAEADAALDDALADVEHAHTHKVGTPRKPLLQPALQSLTGTALCDFLFGDDPLDADEAECEAVGLGFGDRVPNGVRGAEPPASTDRSNDREASTLRHRGAA